MTLLTKWLKGQCKTTTQAPRRRRRTTVLDLELLETRVAPIVGRNLIPAPVMPGGPYDGVVLVQSGGDGTGALINSGSAPGELDGHYILTVAHNNRTGAAGSVTFNLQRNGTPVNIDIPVPANPFGAGTAATQYVINNRDYRGTGFDSINDIALWKLVDPTTPAPNRLLVPPFGAQQYQPYTQANEVTNPPTTQFTIVGYGNTGVGATGEVDSDAVKRMGQNIIDTVGTTLRNQVASIRFAGPGTFRLRWRGALQTTPPLSAASTPAAVLAALNSISFLGVNPLNNNVTVQAAPDVPGSWWVTFTNGQGGRRIPDGWLQATGGAAVTTAAQGKEADQGPGPDANRLVYDFDNGRPQNDAMGLLYGISQLGAAAANEVQRITITGAPTGGTYQLAFQRVTAVNPQPAPLFTAPIAWNASANGPGSVGAALQALATLAGNVRVDGGPGPGMPYVITFINALAGADVNQLTVRNAALTGGTNPQVSVITPTQGSGEIGTGAGDSGAPLFIGDRIVGVHQSAGGFGGRPPFIGPAISTFGTTMLAARVSSYAGAGGFIPTSIAATGPYNLVLDMQSQVAGAARNAAGNWDDLTITASRGGPNNANLLVTVTDDDDPSLSGVYFNGPLASVNGLTLRGAAGDETFVIQGNLGIPTIAVDGRGGDNELKIDDSSTTTNSIRYAVSNTAVSASVINSSTLWTVNYMGINDGLEVDGSSAYNQFSVSNTPTCPTTLNTGPGPNDSTVQATAGPLSVNGQSGIDTLALGNATRGAQDIGGPVNITNARGLTSLSVNDVADPVARNAVVVTPTSLTGLTPFPIAWVERDLNNLGISAGPLGNSFTVNGTPGGAITRLFTGTGNDSVSVTATGGRLEIHGQNGRDQVNIGNANNGVQSVQGPVLVDNDNNSTALTIDDSANTSPRNATLAPTFLTGLAPADINWVETGINSLVMNGATVNAGTVGNNWTVLNTPRLTALPRTTVLNTGVGAVGDTAAVRAASGPLSINGQAGDDLIRFLNFAQSAIIDGGPGNDTIEVAQGTLTSSQIPFTNVESVEVAGGSALGLNSDIATGTVRVINGTLDLRGGTPDVNDRVEIQLLGILTGTGQINGDVLNAGQVRPAGDGAVGRITVRDDYTQAITGRLNLDLQGPEPGTHSDNLEVGHGVSVGGTLNLAALAGFNGDAFTLVSNRGADAVNGAFAGLPEGADVMVGGRQFVITYKGNDGNDVVLHFAQRVNHAPMANGDGYGLVANAPLTVPAAGVLANDSDPDGDPITAILVSGPAHGSLSLNSDGSFAYTPALGYTGGDSFTYKANDGQADSNVATVSLTVSPVATTTAVVSNIPASVFGQAVTFTATVTRSTPGAGAPTGMVEFKSRSPDGSIVVTLGTAPLDTTGRAVFTKNNLVPAAHTVFAVYVGDGTFAGSASADITQYVSKADTAISLSATASTVVSGQPANFLASLSVVPPGAGIVPGTGTITFYDTFEGNTSVVAVITLGGPPVQTPAFTAVGTHLITAVYSGDDNYNGSTSNPFSLTVVPGP
jgi:hypothetical protein